MILSRGLTGRLIDHFAMAAGLLAVGPALPGAARPIFAQTSMQLATRTTIAERVTTLEQQLQGATLKGAKREKATAELAALQVRLRDGDFQVGDKFVYVITQDTAHADTAAVLEGMVVAVSSLPDLSVKGVLRSELSARLTTHVANYLRNAKVRTTILTRISIVGAVARPGYYYALPDRPLSDVIMIAGGPAAEAKLGEVEVRRGNSKTLSANQSKKAIKEGWTLERVEIQSGDEIRVPVKRHVNWQLVIQLFFIISSLFFGLIQFLQWYYNRQQ